MLHYWATNGSGVGRDGGNWGCANGGIQEDALPTRSAIGDSAGAAWPSVSIFHNDKAMTGVVQGSAGRNRQRTAPGVGGGRSLGNSRTHCTDKPGRECVSGRERCSGECGLGTDPPAPTPQLRAGAVVGRQKPSLIGITNAQKAVRRNQRRWAEARQPWLEESPQPSSRVCRPGVAEPPIEAGEKAFATLGLTAS